nr:DNA repair protein XRCC2 isoform X4 [Taeniopygia guttata]XP_030120114.3 DNA repair protein XRCC2 isoform X4 [Taeniopygia guttata]
MADAFGGAESGTQLLARLEGRSSLKNLEPCLFAEEGSPVHDGRTASTSPVHQERFCYLPLKLPRINPAAAPGTREAVPPYLCSGPPSPDWPCLPLLP